MKLAPDTGILNISCGQDSGRTDMSDYMVMRTSWLGANLLLKDNWIRQDNSNFLWLPQEYRDGVSAFHDKNVAFGLNSGQVSILQFHF